MARLTVDVIEQRGLYSLYKNTLIGESDLGSFGLSVNNVGIVSYKYTCGVIRARGIKLYRCSDLQHIAADIRNIIIDFICGFACAGVRIQGFLPQTLDFLNRLANNLGAVVRKPELKRNCKIVCPACGVILCGARVLTLSNSVNHRSALLIACFSCRNVLFRQETEAGLTEAQQSLLHAREQVAALGSSIGELEKAIAELCTTLPFAAKTEALAQKDVLQQKQDSLKAALTRAEAAVNTGKETLAGIRATIAQLEQQLEAGCPTDIPALEEEKNSLTEQKNHLTQKQKNIHTRLVTNRNAQGNISAKAAQIQELETRYSWIRSLSETANGNLAGKEKIMLETYIQTTYFDRILQRANLRLQKMTGGQYDLKRRTSASNLRGQSGLELDIIDHINTTQRSVNTLSGGEAFLASLALALGLSDQVQMSTGIRLDTLFVDEGFGSLDAEALRKAYLTLAGLTEGNRLVGIISHVTELKEKIDRQIVVTKDKTGGSRAEIRV